MEKYGQMPKVFTKEWREHIWYYYKWHFLVGFLVVVLLYVGIYQLVTKVKYDSIVTYVGSADYVYEKTAENIEKELETITSDINTNGKTEVLFQILSYASTSAGQYGEQQIMASELKKTGEIQKGDGMLFIFDEEQLVRIYDNGLAQDTFIPLDDWLENKEYQVADGEASDYFAKVTDSVFFERFELYGEEFYFGIRKIRPDENELATKRQQDAKVIANYIINQK